MARTPTFLDVNVPMYAAGQPHRYQRSCAWVMTEITEGQIAAVTDTEAIQEILHRYGALQRWETARRMASRVLDIVSTVYPVAVADVRLAIDLSEHYAPQGITARDLIHAAVMHNRGITEIISTDAHFDRIEGITRLDPLRWYDQAHPAND